MIDLDASKDVTKSGFHGEEQSPWMCVINFGRTFVSEN